MTAPSAPCWPAPTRPAASEDLDELPELADRVLVMSAGEIVFNTTRAAADRRAIGIRLAGHT